MAITHILPTNITKKNPPRKLGLSIGSQSGCCTDRWFATLQDAAGEIQGVDLGSSSSICLIYLRHPPTMIFFQLPGWPLRDEDVTNGVEKEMTENLHGFHGAKNAPRKKMVLFCDYLYLVFGPPCRVYQDFIKFMRSRISCWSCTTIIMGPPTLLSFFGGYNLYS